MDEREWLTSDDPIRMLAYLEGASTFRGQPSIDVSRPRPSDRKLRMFMAATFRAILPHNAEHELTALLMESDPGFNDVSYLGHGGLPNALAAARLRDVVGNPFRPIEGRMVLRVPRPSTRRIPPGAHPMVPVAEEYSEMNVTLPWLDSILRWNHGTIPTLAQQMYDSRDFSRMPLLADMLEDAGCTDPQILEHCRPQRCDCVKGWISHLDGMSTEPCRKCLEGGIAIPHVRGCWVMDLILGNE